jgi:hypothetical protein
MYAARPEAMHMYLETTQLPSPGPETSEIRTVDGIHRPTFRYGGCCASRCMNPSWLVPSAVTSGPITCQIRGAEHHTQDG